MPSRVVYTTLCYVRLRPASAACTRSCCCLCDACRPIVDNGVWVGYLAKVRYNQKGAPFAWDTMKPHFNWGAAGTTNGGNTGSATGAAFGLGVCMNCTSELKTVAAVLAASFSCYVGCWGRSAFGTPGVHSCTSWQSPLRQSKQAHLCRPENVAFCPSMALTVLERCYWLRQLFTMQGIPSIVAMNTSNQEHHATFCQGQTC
jgi:hypothetical protein